MKAIEEKVEPRSAVGSPKWKALESHNKEVRNLHLRKLFADDPARGERFTASAVGIELDYSKNRITDQTLQLLFQLVIVIPKDFFALRLHLVGSHGHRFG